MCCGREEITASGDHLVEEQTAIEERLRRLSQVGEPSWNRSSAEARAPRSAMTRIWESKPRWRRPILRAFPTSRSKRVAAGIGIEVECCRNDREMDRERWVKGNSPAWGC
jgi:hypothetical protein